MTTSNDFKTGLTIKIDHNIFQIIDFLHVKPGKGSAFVRSKLKNVETGQVIEKTFRAGEKVDTAQLDRDEMQYLFRDGENYMVMSQTTFEQIPLTAAQIGDAVKYLKEEMIIKVVSHEGKVIGVDLPAHVELKIVETPPSEKGNTANGGSKPATLETGAVVQVPFFVENGTLIRVDTRSNEYLDRV